MKGIEIELTPDEYCNCCSSIEKSEEIYTVRFCMGASSTIIKLCKNHLEELNAKINATT